ncbi:LOW QUALITY PROTEIN: uncharacterized protein LOC131669178 [Phymastichus coffea]|uniref:LOW QUALITY PROTEIN: uncharacterized protein LOC131669178 n=1 Tax=Phymastichus coffea TaxID=108790 RepID=UPI00273B5687|nr:LOW QUALITY PROTEIN: uncharacterized protein LOC131669178 [Phymastichus coffea]
MTMKQWRELRSRSQMETCNKSENGLSRSTSSYNSAKNMSSENFARKVNDDDDDGDDDGDGDGDGDDDDNDDDDNDDDDDGEDEECDEPAKVKEKTRDDSRLHVVLTPRTPKEEQQREQEQEETDPPAEVAAVRAKNSLSSVKTTSKKPRKMKSRKKSQVVRMSDEQLRASLIYSAKAKRKKLHGRLRNSNSKSTIATRDTDFSDKKLERKKLKRQKSLDSMSALQLPRARKRANALRARESKQLGSKADLVEIFHGKAARSGALSGRLSKDVARTVAKRGNERSDRQSRRAAAPTPSRARTRGKGFASRARLSGCWQGSSATCRDPPGREAEESGEAERYQVHAQQTKDCDPEVYDPFCPRNYELPTMASRMKRVHKPYYHHFKIKSIPFVVGTSLSPSHNLGLNIQQVLSIIKVKRPAVPGISPLLVRKVSRGVRPVSSLFEHINSQYARAYRDLGRRRSGSHQQIGSFSCEQLVRASSSLGGRQLSFKQPNVTCEPLYEVDEDVQSSGSDSHARNGQQQDDCNRARKQQQQQQQQHCHHQHSVESGSIFGARSSNNKEITEVFTKLYDQFDKMVSQHERLKEQLEKRRDKALLKEVSELETAMSSKEREINAVINLYNEVISLKKQMKLLHERNSFVCIATPDPSFQSTPVNVRARTAPGPYLNAKPSRREMPNALKLVGLLRQMQAFQRQLALA